jgi:hypothetical protein
MDENDAFNQNTRPKMAHSPAGKPPQRSGYSGYDQMDEGNAFNQNAAPKMAHSPAGNKNP